MIIKAGTPLYILPVNFTVFGAIMMLLSIIDKTYKLGGTGMLLNANEIGWGYDAQNTPELKPISTEKRIWHFTANNVHDFMWAADPEYKHIVRRMPNNGTILNVLYKFKANNGKNDSAWTLVADAAVKVLPLWKVSLVNILIRNIHLYRVVMAGWNTHGNIIGGPGLGNSISRMDAQLVPDDDGTNESLYAWMDEGFTSYAEDVITSHITIKQLQ